MEESRLIVCVCVLCAVKVGERDREIRGVGERQRFRDSERDSEIQRERERERVSEGERQMATHLSLTTPAASFASLPRGPM